MAAGGSISASTTSSIIGVCGGRTGTHSKPTSACASNWRAIICCCSRTSELASGTALASGLRVKWWSWSIGTFWSGLTSYPMSFQPKSSCDADALPSVVGRRIAGRAAPLRASSNPERDAIGFGSPIMNSLPLKSRIHGGQSRPSAVHWPIECWQQKREH